jgi:hypothetical protein
MNVILNVRETRWGRMLIVMIVVFAAVFGVSALLGDIPRHNCFWAIVVNSVAACGGVVLFVYAGLFKQSIPASYLQAALAVRLPLAVIGSGIVLYFVKVDAFWFVVWMAMLYIVVLIVEVLFFVKMLTGRSEVEKV